MWHELRLLFKRLFMALVAALATFGLLVGLALKFWVLPFLMEHFPPVEPVLESHATAEGLTAAQRPEGCQSDKRTCKDMSSCDEAKFYLTTCGLKRLDRDGDGVPCEKLCR